MEEASALLGELRSKKCSPCRGGEAPLARGKAEEMLSALPSWKISPDGKSIRRQLLMKDFMAAVSLIRAIAAAAESEDHHPDLHLTGYRRLEIALSTHAVGGLSLNDFILAAKIEDLPKELK